MSEDIAARQEVVDAILGYLGRQDGRTWYQIDRRLSNSGRLAPGPYMAELKYLVATGRLRKDGDAFWLVDTANSSS